MNGQLIYFEIVEDQLQLLALSPGQSVWWLTVSLLDLVRLLSRRMSSVEIIVDWRWERARELSWPQMVVHIRGVLCRLPHSPGMTIHVIRLEYTEPPVSLLPHLALSHYHSWENISADKLNLKFLQPGSVTLLTTLMGSLCTRGSFYDIIKLRPASHSWELTFKLFLSRSQTRATLWSVSVLWSILLVMVRALSDSLYCSCLCLRTNSVLLVWTGVTLSSNCQTWTL